MCHTNKTWNNPPPPLYVNIYVKIKYWIVSSYSLVGHSRNRVQTLRTNFHIFSLCLLITVKIVKLQKIMNGTFILHWITTFLFFWIFCYVIYGKIDTLRSRPTGTKVSSINVKKSDIPVITICPEPNTINMREFHFFIIVEI